MITRFRFTSPSLYSSSRWARFETAFSSSGSIFVDTLETSISQASRISIFFSFSHLISRKSWASISSFNSNFRPLTISLLSASSCSLMDLMSSRWIFVLTYMQYSL